MNKNDKVKDFDEQTDFGIIPFSEFNKTVTELNTKIEKMNNRLNKLIELTEELALIVHSKS